MKGRSIWKNPKLNNNMDTEKVEVKYMGNGGRLSPTTGGLSALPFTATKFSMLLSILSLVIAVSFFCLVLAWLWGVPEKIAQQNQEIERLEHLIEKQQDVLDEMLSPGNKAKSLPTNWNLQFDPASVRDSASCLLPPSPGPCTTVSLQRWHYHAPSRRCRQFTYGGCHGNNNNFVTAMQCEKICGGVEQPDLAHVGPSFNGISGKNNNGDKVPAKDSWRQRCLLPPTSGPCRGQLSRYYWDENNEACSTFSYGGCAGNTNNFVSQRECLNSCQKEPEIPVRTWDTSLSNPRLVAPDGPQPVSQCLQMADPGDCTSSLLRWYFHSKTSTCRIFTWGGCGGNDNNFLTEAKCDARCGNNTREATMQEDEGGNITEGNDDGGDVMEKVVDKDSKDDNGGGEGESRDEICSKPADTGDCRGSLARFFYNIESEKCEDFTYGGCGGNKNNFLTEDDCKKNCVHL